jgi:hypothetical protein
MGFDETDSNPSLSEDLATTVFDGSPGIKSAGGRGALQL